MPPAARPARRFSPRPVSSCARCMPGRRWAYFGGDAGARSGRPHQAGQYPRLRDRPRPAARPPGLHTGGRGSIGVLAVRYLPSCAVPWSFTSMDRGVGEYVHHHPAVLGHGLHRSCCWRQAGFRHSLLPAAGPRSPRQTAGSRARSRHDAATTSGCTRPHPRCPYDPGFPPSRAGASSARGHAVQHRP